MRNTFVIKFIVKDKAYKKEGYPFPNFVTLGAILETILEVMAEYPTEEWDKTLTEGYAKLLPCKEGEKSDYIFYFDEKGVYDKDYNLIDTIENRIKVWHDPRWDFHSSSRNYREDPLGLATPESMEGDEMAKRLLKSAVDVLRETTT